MRNCLREKKSVSLNSKTVTEKKKMMMIILNFFRYKAISQTVKIEY